LSPPESKKLGNLGTLGCLHKKLRNRRKKANKKSFHHEASRIPRPAGKAAWPFFKLGEINRMEKTAFLMPRTASKAFRENR
jgi:hypothetical protein